MSFSITNLPIDTQFQDTQFIQPQGIAEQEIVIFNGENAEIPTADTLELSSHAESTNVQQTQKEKINELNNKFKNLTKEQIQAETINEKPYDQNGKDAFGLTEKDYELLCSVNPELSEDMVKAFGARAAFFTNKSLNDLPVEMESSGFKKHGSQAEQEMLVSEPYINENGQDKFGKTEEDYYKMLEEYGFTREMIDATKLGPRRAYFAHIQNMENNGQKIAPLKEVFQDE